MKIVDSHCHAGLSWFEPVETLVYQLDTNGVEQGVLIQHRGAYDNSYLFECAERYPGRFSVVVLVNLADGSAPDELERLAAMGAAGVRLGPTDRSPGSDPLAIWRRASDLGLPVSSLGNLDEFASPEFDRLVTDLPDLTIVVEHLAVGTSKVTAPYSDFKRAMELARHDNVYIKVGGLGEISSRPAELTREFVFHDTPPLVEMVCEAFGPRRMMWGSDFPPVSNREGYANALRAIAEHPAFGSDADREWVMGKTAAGVFRLE